MKTRLNLLVAAAATAGAASIAFGQTAPTWPANTTEPSPEAAPTLVQGPVASAAKTGGDDAGLVDGVVSALNAEPSLKDSKITVASEDGTVTLTGATQTPDQRKKAGEIAAAQAGDDKVVNAVLDSKG
ncbi:MAG TPA: BON domain-containing protein [Usitatibacter sp.]|jgi:hypothetical protein|nr:BON domain-containing protein [Usitatibacter sp.]